LLVSGVSSLRGRPPPTESSATGGAVVKCRWSMTRGCSDPAPSRQPSAPLTGSPDPSPPVLARAQPRNGSCRRVRGALAFVQVRFTLRWPISGGVASPNRRLPLQGQSTEPEPVPTPTPNPIPPRRLRADDWPTVRSRSPPERLQGGHGIGAAGASLRSSLRGSIPARDRRAPRAALRQTGSIVASLPFGEAPYYGG